MTHAPNNAKTMIFFNCKKILLNLSFFNYIKIYKIQQALFTAAYFQ